MSAGVWCATAAGEPLRCDAVSAVGAVNGTLLELRLEQHFACLRDAVLRYAFELPWRAVLLGVEVRLGEQRLRGIVAARGRAGPRAARPARAAPSRRIEVELGRLAAGQSCVVVLRYAQQLQADAHGFCFVLPAAFFAGGSEAGTAFEFGLRVRGPLARARIESGSHAVSTRCNDDETLVWLDPDAIGSQRELSLRFCGLDRGSIGIAAPERQSDGIGVAMAGFTPVPLGEPARPVAIKLLLDCSGALDADSLAAARRALAEVVGSLQPQDRIGLSRLAASVEHRCRSLWPVAGAAKSAALRWLASQQPDPRAGEPGQASMAEALRSLLAQPQRADLLLAVASPLSGVEELLEAARASGQRVFVVGVGAFEAGWRRLALASGGACEFVAAGEPMAIALRRMALRLRSPWYTGLRVEWPVDCERLSESALPQRLFECDTLTLYARLRYAYPLALQGCARLFGRPQRDPQSPPGREQLIAELSPAAFDDAAGTLTRLAASARCDELRHLIDTPAFLRSELPALAEHHQLLTEETCLLLVPDGRQAALVATVPGAGLPAIAPVAAARARSDAGDAVGRGRAIDLELAEPSRVARQAAQLRTAAARAIDRLAEIELPPFLRWQGGTLQEPRFWSVDGLTPAGFVEHLRRSDESDWPSDYDGLRATGLPPDVCDWLEFVVGAGRDEQQVVLAFLQVMLDAAFTLRQGLARVLDGLRTRLPGLRPDWAGAVDAALLQQLRSALSLDSGRWPDSVLRFAEAD